MADPYRTIRPGEPIDGRHPFFSASRGNVLSQLAKQAQGVPLPGAAKSTPGGRPRYGVVKTATAAEWNNDDDELTYGELEVWEFAEGTTTATINRAGPTVSLVYRWTDPPDQGALVGWIGTEVVVITCGTLQGWS